MRYLLMGFCVKTSLGKYACVVSNDASFLVHLQYRAFYRQLWLASESLLRIVYSSAGNASSEVAQLMIETIRRTNI